MAQVRILQLGVCPFVERRRLRSPDQERNGVPVEFHRPSSRPRGAGSGTRSAAALIDQPASGFPVSRTVFSPLRTKLQPPATLSAVFGDSSSWSCTTVRLLETPSCPSLSQLTLLKGSAAVSGS